MTTRDRSDPWHVAHVIGSMTTGGAERALVNYLRVADRTDFRHTVVCLGSRGDLAAVVEASGIPVRVLRIRHRHLLWSVARLAHWLRREHVDVVHTHMYGAGFWGRVAGRLADVRVLVNTVHGPEPWMGWRHVLGERFLNRWTSRHIAVAQDGLEIRLRRERVPRDRIRLIPNGVTIPEATRDADSSRRARAEFGLPSAAPVVGSVGRFVPEKGYGHLLAALALARAEIPDLRWLAIGDGELRPVLAARAEAAGLATAVVWAGLRPDVEALLPAIDVWVMSSVEEGLPVALLEAMAAGCPIVATRVGGIPDAVQDGREAVLVPPGDAAALATAIVGLLRDPERARRLGAGARTRAIADYSITSVARRVESIYREELAREKTDD